MPADAIGKTKSWREEIPARSVFCCTTADILVNHVTVRPPTRFSAILFAASIAAELDALLPAIFENASKGEL